MPVNLPRDDEEIKYAGVENEDGTTFHMPSKPVGADGVTPLFTDSNPGSMKLTGSNPQDKLIYGAYWNKGSDPTMTRTDAAVDMVANAGVDGQLVKNDFDNAPIWGEIEEVEDEYGNVFIKIPKVYIRKHIGKDFLLEKLSKTKHPGFYLPWCFWDFENNKELDYILVGKHEASLSDDNKLESKPNKYPLINKNIVEFRDYAKANNAIGLKGYQQHDVHVQDLLAVLFHIEFATLNSQSIMQGFTAGRYTDSELATVAETNVNRIIVANATADQYRIGQVISVGTSQGGNQVFYGRTITAIENYDTNNKAILFDGDPVNIAVGNYLYNTGWITGFSKNILAASGSIGSNTDGKYPCSYRGVENIWGNVYKWVDGINIDARQAWVAKNAEDYTSNVFTSPHEKLGYVNASENGYPMDMGFYSKLPFANLPNKVGGSSSTYYSDYYYQNTGQCVALVGGSWYNGSYAGLSLWALSSSSGYRYVNFGGRLLKKAL
ncbi:hypothetical protein EV207_101168 [Scopulibacillus darangshiensis]|uniref:Uncharacterized protein n=1 Tax=Scopulibacillus darangshiensis TaxID=442528 RepID=A0A4R2PAS9_9BACL|nr:hypothetical protein [Scopulibacillus darangshiensis]TCP32190.1 hypothetical protein EV207_101168 [Scopulibacillus darangshiensis]